MTVNRSYAQVEGTITENLPNATFRVQVGDGQTMLCHLIGRMRLRRVRLLPGDRVKVETDLYDATRGRVIFKIKQ